MGPDEEVSISELARRLGLSKTATYARVDRALVGGWLINREEREGKRYPAKLVRGADFPENLPVLPTKKDLSPKPPPKDPSPESGVEQSVSDDAAEKIDDAPSTIQRDCSSDAIVEQSVEQQLTDAVTKENLDCSTVLVDTGLLPPSPLLSDVVKDPDAMAERDAIQHEDDAPMPETVWDLFPDDVGNPELITEGDDLLQK